MSFRTVPISSNRRRIYHFLQRSLRFHAPCTVGTEVDVTDLRAALAAARARGEAAGFTAALVKATGVVVRRHPGFNRHLFHGPLGRKIVEFDDVHCALMVQRKDETGEDVLFPAILRDADTRTVAELAATIDRYKHGALEELPEYQALARLRKLPTPVRLALAYRQRSNPAFYEKTFTGTYGMSAYAGHARGPITTGHALAPTASSFFVGAAVEKPWVVGGAVVPRTILSLGCVVDHYLVDGVELVDVLGELGELLRDPAALGLAPAGATAAAVASAA
jgi:pyruvate/2-oxoglutarate dehydrogenase complex dihydrolipoamide acyltransferase (E2) component